MICLAELGTLQGVCACLDVASFMMMLMSVGSWYRQWRYLFTILLEKCFNPWDVALDCFRFGFRAGLLLTLQKFPQVSLMVAIEAAKANDVALLRRVYPDTWPKDERNSSYYNKWLLMAASKHPETIRLCFEKCPDNIDTLCDDLYWYTLYERNYEIVRIIENNITEHRAAHIAFIRHLRERDYGQCRHIYRVAHRWQTLRDQLVAYMVYSGNVDAMNVVRPDLPHVIELAEGTGHGGIPMIEYMFGRFTFKNGFVKNFFIFGALSRAVHDSNEAAVQDLFQRFIHDCPVVHMAAMGVIVRLNRIDLFSRALQFFRIRASSVHQMVRSIVANERWVCLRILMGYIWHNTTRFSGRDMYPTQICHIAHNRTDFDAVESSRVGLTQADFTNGEMYTQTLYHYPELFEPMAKDELALLRL